MATIAASWNAAGKRHDGFIVNVPKQNNMPTANSASPILLNIGAAVAP